MDARSIWTLLALMIVSGPLEVRAQGYRPDLRLRPTPLSIGEQTAGERFWMRSLTLTENYPGYRALTIMGGQLVFTSVTNSAFAYLRWSDSLSGLESGALIGICAGCAIHADIIEPRQTGLVPVRIDGTHGMRLNPRATVGTCGSSEEPEGTEIMLTATVTSRTRKCLCTNNGSGTYAWENNRGSVGNTTTCPEVTP